MEERLSDVRCRLKDEERNFEQVVHIDRIKESSPTRGPKSNRIRGNVI